MNNNNPALSSSWRLKFYFTLLWLLVAILVCIGIGLAFLYFSIVKMSEGGFIEAAGCFIAFSLPFLVCALVIFVRVFLVEIRMFRNMRVEPLTPEQLFALALGAILAETNKHRHDTIYGDRPSILLKAGMRLGLVRNWNIKNSQQLIETLHCLSEGGCCAEYEEMYDAISDAWPISDAFQLLDEKDVKKMKSAERKSFQRRFACIVKHRTQFSSILAWDLCRLVAVARWGVGAEYITEDEAWIWILDAAQRLKSEFGSWKELGENYLLGRNFWGFTDSKPEKAFKKLIKGNNSSSPWNRIPWIPAAD